jgi:hypothetical protein
MAITISNMAFLPLVAGARRVYSSGSSRTVGSKECPMVNLSLFVRLEAKPGKENDVAAFLKQGLELANRESYRKILL